MVARARRVAGFGSGKAVGESVLLSCAGRARAAGAVCPSFADVLKTSNNYCLHKCAQDSRGLALERHASSEMLRD